MYYSKSIPANTRFADLTASVDDHLSLAEFLNLCADLGGTAIYVHTRPVNECYLIYVPTAKEFMELPINYGAGGDGWMCLTRNDD